MNRQLSEVLLLIFVFLGFLNLSFSAREDRLPTNLSNLKAVVGDIMGDWQVPGLAMAIVEGGQVLLAEGFGLRDIHLGLRVTPLTIFPIASITKTFTAVSVAILVDEGTLKWDVPVKDYVPSLRFYDDYVGSHITLRDLLAHRSGLPQHYRMYFNRHLMRNEIVERVRFLEPSGGFREKFQYANLNYTIAAHILEEVSKRSWEDFVQERILDPVGMNRSNFSIAESQKRSDFALPYREEDGKIKETCFFDPNAMGMGPAGSINSNALDMANWLLFHLEKGKYKDRRIVAEAGLAETQRPQIVVPGIVTDEMFYASYGLGWAITSYRGHLMIGHGGGFDGFSGYVSILPRDDIGCVILCNLEGSSVPQILTRIVYDRLLGLSDIPWNERQKSRDSKAKVATEKKGEPFLPKAQRHRPLGDYCGEFKHPAYGVLTIKKEQDQLVAIHNELISPLTHLFYDVFETTDEAFGIFKISFFIDDNGAIDRVGVPFEPEVSRIIFNRIIDRPERVGKTA